MPQSCLDPSVIFAGLYNPACGGFAMPSKFQAEKALISNLFSEWIDNYGMDVNYYINGFNISKSDILYGEHTLQEYSAPFAIRAFAEMEEDHSYTPFGIQADDSLTIYIHIDRFRNTFIQFLQTESGEYLYDEAGNQLTIDAVETLFFEQNGQRVEPKSDDLIEITAFGCDRPGNRGNKIFRVTQVLDQSIQDGINPFYSHSVWKINAVRYETSHETNAPVEVGNEQVYDNTFSGKLSSVSFPAMSSIGKSYEGNVDTISKEEVYDMSGPDATYGGYY